MIARLRALLERWLGPRVPLSPEDEIEEFWSQVW